MGKERSGALVTMVEKTSFTVSTRADSQSILRAPTLNSDPVTQKNYLGCN